MSHEDLKRPRLNACTPTDATVLELLGGVSWNGINYTKSQMQAFEKIYGPLDHNEMNQRLRPDFTGPLKQNEESAAALLEAGARRNIFRAVESDGLRCMGALSKHLQQGEDPVKFLIRLMSDAGYDVGDDIEWAETEEEGEE